MMCTILACLRDSLTYMRQVAIHTMDYVYAATSNILSPDIPPVEDLRSMLRCIESELPSEMHLPISLDDTLHFYCVSQQTCLNSRRTVPASHQCAHTKQSTKAPNIYKVFNLSGPQSNLSASTSI